MLSLLSRSSAAARRAASMAAQARVGPIVKMIERRQLELHLQLVFCLHEFYFMRVLHVPAPWTHRAPRAGGGVEGPPRTTLPATFLGLASHAPRAPDTYSLVTKISLPPSSHPLASEVGLGSE